MDLLLERMRHMTELTSLTISCQPFERFKLATSIATTTLLTHGVRLRNLSLTIPLEYYPGILAAAQSVTTLEHLSVELRIAFQTTIFEELFPVLIEFIQRQSNSLQSLSVDTPHPIVDPFQFFRNLGLLPNLKKLSVLHPIDRLQTQYSPGLDIFLASHSSSLEEVSIRFTGFFRHGHQPNPVQFFSHPILRVRLPHLTSLELGLRQWPSTYRYQSAEQLSNYVRPLANSLSSIAIHDRVLTFPEVEKLISVIGGENSHVRSLDVHMYFLSCDLLDLLSRRLPGLVRLNLAFEALTSKDDGGVVNTRNFASSHDVRSSIWSSILLTDGVIPLLKNQATNLSRD